MSPRQCVEILGRCESGPWSRPDVYHQTPGVVVDADVIIIRRIVRGCYVVDYFGSGNVVGQEESPKLGSILSGTLIGSGTLAAGCKEWQGRGAAASRRGNCDRSGGVRDGDVLARSECAEHRSVARRPDQNLPVGRGWSREQIRGTREVGDSIRRARKSAGAGNAANPTSVP